VLNLSGKKLSERFSPIVSKSSWESKPEKINDHAWYYKYIIIGAVLGPIIGISHYTYKAYNDLKSKTSMMMHLMNDEGMTYIEHVQTNSIYVHQDELTIKKGKNKVKFIDGLDEIPAMHVDYHYSQIEEMIITIGDSTKTILFNNQKLENPEDFEKMMVRESASRLYNKMRRNFVMESLRPNFKSDDLHSINYENKIDSLENKLKKFY